MQLLSGTNTENAAISFWSHISSSHRTGPFWHCRGWQSLDSHLAETFRI